MLTHAIWILLIMLIIIGLMAAAPISPAMHTPIPTLELIREAVELSVLEADISTVTTTRLDGYTGHVRCCLIVRGTVRIGTDLNSAVIQHIDLDQRHITLTLAPPKVLSVRIDHEASHVYAVDRGGLWQALPFAARESDVLIHAWQQAESHLHQAAQRDDLLDRANQRTQTLITQALQNLGWTIRFDVKQTQTVP